MDEVLPIDGWKACGIDFNSKGCIVKYKHADMSYLRCPCCGEPGLTIHRRYTVRVSDLPLGIHHTTLEVEVFECWCDRCRRFLTIKPTELHSTKGMTWRLMWHITWLVKEGSAVDVARTLGISESSVRRANKTVLEVLDYLNPLQLDNLEAIIVDEKYLGRRLRFITVVTNKFGEILHIGKGKGEASLKAFFDLLTDEQKQAIKVVGADRSNAYTSAVRKYLPNAEICYDRFHIGKNANDSVAKVRRNEVNEKSKDENGKAEAKAMKSSKYVLQQNPENMKEKGRERLERLLALNENINKAYILKEELRALYTLDDPEEASSHLEAWISMAAESGLKPFIAMSKTLKEQASAVLGYFRYKLTSGVIEGVNSKIAKIQFQMRGITSVRYLYLKLRESTCRSFHEALAPVGWS